MTVKELMKELEGHKPDAEILIRGGDEYNNEPYFGSLESVTFIDEDDGLVKDCVAGEDDVVLVTGPLGA